MFYVQTDGFIEVINKLIENYWRIYANLKQWDWAMLLRTAEFAYNNSFNHSFKMTPFKCVYGYDPEFYIDVGDVVLDKKISSAKERVEMFKELRWEL